MHWEEAAPHLWIKILHQTNGLTSWTQGDSQAQSHVHPGPPYAAMLPVSRSGGNSVLLLSEASGQIMVCPALAVVRLSHNPFRETFMVMVGLDDLLPLTQCPGCHLKGISFTVSHILRLWAPCLLPGNVCLVSFMVASSFPLTMPVSLFKFFLTYFVPPNCAIWIWFYFDWLWYFMEIHDDKPPATCIPLSWSLNGSPELHTSMVLKEGPREARRCIWACAALASDPLCFILLSVWPPDLPAHS